MDAEPDTLSLWSTMVAALKNHISYGPGVKQLVSDINVTDIFIKRDGARDEDAITFWSQIITIKGVKNEVETLLSHTLKRRKEKGIMVQQIPLSRSSEISKEFIEYVIEKIRNTPSLWNVGDVKFMKSKQGFDNL
jgi:isocitrate dehydrogenase